MLDGQDQIARIKRAAEGRWREIAEAAGIPEVHLEKDGRPCPLCGGRDRFSFFRKRTDGRWFCRGCGYGDGIALIQRFRRESFGATLRWLAAYLGLPEVAEHSVRTASRQISRQDKRDREQRKIRELWESSMPVWESDSPNPARLYLSRRSLADVDRPQALRWTPKCPYWVAGEDGELKKIGEWPAMLALVVNDAGEAVAVHRIYLTAEGNKAPVPTPKKRYGSGLGEGFVRLYPPSSILCLAEGVETALAVHCLTGLPVWSALSLSGFHHFEAVPAGVEVIKIYGDNDASFAGAAGAYELAARLRRSHPELRVEVHIPEGKGEDWNDVLSRRIKTSAW